MYTNLVIKLFPVVAISLALLAKYCLHNLETRILAIKSIGNSEQLTCSILETKSLLYPVKSAMNLLDVAGGVLNSDSLEWLVVLNTSAALVESRFLNVTKLHNDDLPVHRISMIVDSALNETEVFNRLTSSGELKNVFPRFWRNGPISISQPPLMQYDWCDGHISVQYITTPFLWPFYDRTYTVLAVKHPETLTFAAQSIFLSPVDEKMFLPTPLKNKGTKRAYLSMALRVRTLHGRGNQYTHKIEFLYSVSGFMSRVAVDHFLAVEYFIPNVIHSISNLFV